MANLDIQELRNPALRDFFSNIFTGETALEGINVQADKTSIPVSFKTSAPVNAVASAGLLTVGVQPTVGDTFTIGTKVYTFVTDETASADGEVDVGADLADAKVQIIAAINGTDHNDASTVVTAGTWATDELTLTAITKGTAGDLIATTETFDNAGNFFDALTLGTEVAGVDGTVGAKGQAYVDASYLYFAVAANTVADTNWRRISLGSAY